MTARQRHTSETVIQTLKNIAARLGRTSLAVRDVKSHIPESSVRYLFGSIEKAVNAAGLS